MEQLAFGTRTTRKSHQCWHCNEAIPVGSRVHWQANVDAGEAWTLYMHLVCYEVCAACPEFHLDGCHGGECPRGERVEI